MRFLIVFAERNVATYNEKFKREDVIVLKLRLKDCMSNIFVVPRVLGGLLYLSVCHL